MTHTFTYKMVIVIRKDLNIRMGKLAVQVGHGVAISMYNSDPTLVKNWMDEGMKKVVLRASDAYELEELEKECNVVGIKCYSIVDLGLTQLIPNTKTGIVIGIDTVEKIDLITGRLSLL
jgi:PTH2 family peptidyl-tRNA hydrolase